MERYESYKDSGIDWLGEIPSHWELLRLKHIFSEKKKVWNFNLPAGSISFGKVIYKSDEKIPDSTKATYQEVLKGEFLINPLNLNYDLISLRIALSEIDVVVSSGYIVLQNIIKIHKDYYKWLLHIYDILYMKLLGSGVRQTISFNHIANSDLAFPPIPEQEAIASFLDEKCSKIDELVAIKEQQIDKLKELRQVKIHEAVTKGLDTSVELKDSGIDWIGEIPKHWEVKRLKHISNVVLGKMLCNENKGNYDYKPYLKSKNIQWLNVNVGSVDYMWFSKYEQIIYRLKKGDLILSEGGEVGKVCIWNNELDDCYIQNSAHKVTVDKYNNSTFHLYTLFSAGKMGIFDAIVNKVSIGHLTREKLINILLPIPPLTEQEAIVSYLEQETAKIDNAIAQRQEQIEKLKAYKQSLINEVVTGKVKVA